MYNSELKKVFYSKRSLIFIFLIFVIPFIDLIGNWKDTFMDFYLHPEFYDNVLSSKQIIHPAKASFLSGSSTGHIAQILLIWILPLYVLIIYSDFFIREKENGYSNIIFSKSSRKVVLKRRFIISFLVPASIIFLSLSLNFILSLFLFNAGSNFQGIEENIDSSQVILIKSLNHPNITYFVYIVIFSMISGVVGLICTSIAFLFPKYKYCYSICFFIWIFLIIIKDSVTFLFQPFIEYEFKDMVIPLLLLITLTVISVVSAWIYKVKYDEV